MLTEDALGEGSATDYRQAVLVVDDDARLRDLLCTVLTPLDCDIAQAGSGEEALTALLQRKVAVIVLDINMPGMDGFETAQLIRDVEELASTPIIFLTGQAEAGDLGRGYDLGAVDFLMKPVSRQVFFAKVKALLELDRSFARLRAAAAKLHEEQLMAEHLTLAQQHTKIAPHSVCLELTERAFIGDPAPAHKALRAVRDRGFSLAMDDFGVEHASMANLVHVPVDWLKIDRSFVARVHEDERVQRLVRSQISVAANMQADLIAEGVEVNEQADWLKGAGCDLQQGFLYSHPIETTELAAYVDSRTAVGADQGANRN